MSGKIIHPAALRNQQKKRLLADSVYFEQIERKVACDQLRDHENWICSRSNESTQDEDGKFWHVIRMPHDIGNQVGRRMRERAQASSMLGVSCPVRSTTREEDIAAYKSVTITRDYTKNPGTRTSLYLTFEQHQHAKEVLARLEEWDRTRYNWRHKFVMMPEHFNIKHGLSRPDIFI